MADPYATVTAERRQRIATVRELRARGLLQREIAAEMGISRNNVSDLLADPENTKKRARRLIYGGTCKRCGALTDGSQGNKASPEICKDCAALELHEQREWTKERIIAAFITFRERVGRAPTTVDIHVLSGAPSIERRLSDARVAEIKALPRDLRLPHYDLVRREFGSWPAALEAAGLPPNPTGGAGHRVKERKGVMPRNYVVFSKNGHGWIPRETVEARDSDEAIQKVADGEGTYVAVAEPNWQERTVAPKTVFAVVESE
jgi:predicted transcriptional regulator